MLSERSGLVEPNEQRPIRIKSAGCVLVLVLNHCSVVNRQKEKKVAVMFG